MERELIFTADTGLPGGKGVVLDIVMHPAIAERIAMNAGKPPRVATTHRGLEPEDITRLEQARGLMWEEANRDCDCYLAAGGEKLCCDTCRARDAIAAIDKVLLPVYESLQPDRMRNVPERIYVQKWREEQNRDRGTNHGFGLLELILQSSGEKYPPHVSQRDATVASSVIQWLGTNCGRCFVEDCERRIVKARNTERRYHAYPCSCGTSEAYQEVDAATDMANGARIIAENFISIDRHKDGAWMLTLSILDFALVVQAEERQGCLEAAQNAPAFGTLAAIRARGPLHKEELQKIGPVIEKAKAWDELCSYARDAGHTFISHETRLAMDSLKRLVKRDVEAKERDILKG